MPRFPKKFKVVTEVKDGQILVKEVLGYDIPLPYEYKLKTFTCAHLSGWQVFHVTTGACLVGATKPTATEEEAINALTAFINQTGVEEINRQLDDYVKKNKELVDKWKEQQKTNAALEVISSDTTISSAKTTRRNNTPADKIAINRLAASDKKKNLKKRK